MHIVCPWYFSFFCDKFDIEKHPNYKLLEDADEENAYLLSDVNTVKYQFCNEQENENIHSENSEESTELNDDLCDQIVEIVGIGRERLGKKLSGEDVPDMDFEQSVTTETLTIDEIIGGIDQENIAPIQFPKAPQHGNIKAVLNETDMIVTNENYLDIF